MIALGLLIVVVGAIVLGLRAWPGTGGAERDPEEDAPRVTPAPSTTTSASREPEHDGEAVEELLERWVRARLINAHQSEEIERFEHARFVEDVPTAAARRRIPAFAEALGYLGGILSFEGVGQLVGRQWPSMATGTKLVLSGAVAVALAIIGWAVPEERDPAFARLRSVVWLASLGASGLFAGAAAYDGWGITRPTTVALVIAVVLAATAAAMWQLRDRPPQQVVTLMALVVAVGTGTSGFASSGFVGLSVAVAGAVVIASAWWSPMVRPPLNVLLGSLAVVVGGAIMQSDWLAAGLIFSVLTSMCMLSIAAASSLDLDRSRRRTFGAIGVLSLATSAPPAIGYFAERAGIVTGLVVWFVGDASLTLALRRQVRAVGLVELASAVALIGGASICAAQSRGFSSIFGILTALTLLAVGTRPGEVMLSIVGSMGLLAFVPASIFHFFPGPGRAPLITLVSGGLILGLALVLSRERERIPHEMSSLFGHPWSGHHGRMSH